MIGCRRARALLVEHVRGAVGEAALFQLDQHLAACAECRRERARWETVSSLREAQPPSLNDAARARIVERLIAPRAPAASPRRAAPRAVFVFAGVAAVAVAALVWRGARPTAPSRVAPLLTAKSPNAASPKSPSPGAVASAAPSPEGPRRWDAPGTLGFLDAKLGYRAGTALHLEPRARAVKLDAGELEVTAAAGSPPLRVVTPRFSFTLRQAHAVFAASAVRVLDGEVDVYLIGDRWLATIPAGRSWSPDAAAKTSAAEKISAPALTVAARAAAPSRAPANGPVASALEHARSALADGDAPRARRWLDEALGAHPSEHDRAEAELFWAESYLVEEEPDRAVAAFRKVADSFARLPEGESAAFAAAQVLFERGRSAEAARALADYLARWPSGRFSREARDRLSEIPTPEP